MNVVYARSALSGTAGRFDTLVARWARDAGSRSLICVSDSSEVVTSLETELSADDVGVRIAGTTVPRSTRGDRGLAWQAVLLAADEDAWIICRGLALARAMATSATSRNSTLASTSGRNAIRPCTRVMSEMARLTTWPVPIWS